MNSYFPGNNNLCKGGIRLHWLFTARNEGTEQQSGPNCHSNGRQWGLINREPAQNSITAFINYQDLGLLERVDKNTYVCTPSCTVVKRGASISHEILPRTSANRAHLQGSGIREAGPQLPRPGHRPHPEQDMQSKPSCSHGQAREHITSHSCVTRQIQRSQPVSVQ